MVGATSTIGIATTHCIVVAVILVIRTYIHVNHSSVLHVLASIAVLTNQKERFFCWQHYSIKWMPIVTTAILYDSVVMVYTVWQSAAVPVSVIAIFVVPRNRANTEPSGTGASFPTDTVRAPWPLDVEIS